LHPAVTILTVLRSLPQGQAMASTTNSNSLQLRNPNFSLEACLGGTGMSVSIVKPLTGGLVNYVWRITDTSGKTLILKHAESTLKLNPSIKSDPARLSHEARGLQSDLVLTACKAIDGITVARAISYNEKLHTLITTDGGNQNLAEAYETGKLDMRDVGKRLAIWAAALHKASWNTSPEAWKNELTESVSMVAAAGMP
jgi:hypothetical protein